MRQRYPHGDVEKENIFTCFSNLLIWFFVVPQKAYNKQGTVDLYRLSVSRIDKSQSLHDQ
jgi:hypothetical protein